MRKVKEKPKPVKSKKNRKQSTLRSAPAISAKQAAKLMKDKYVQQLDRRQAETSSAETQAAEKVEGAGTWAMDELLVHERPHFPRQQKAPAAGTGYGWPYSENVAGPCQTPGAKLPQSMGVPPTEEAAQAERVCQAFAKPQPGPNGQTTIAPAKRELQVKERSVLKIKNKGAQSTTATIKQRPTSPSKSIVSIESIHPPEQRSAVPARPSTIHSTTPAAPTVKQPTAKAFFSPTTAPIQTAGQPPSNKLNTSRMLSAQKKNRPQQVIRGSRATSGDVGQQLPRVRKSARGAAPKTRDIFYQKGVSLPKSSRPLGKTAASKITHTARQTVQRRMTHRAVQQIRNTVKAPVAVLKKTAAVATRVAATLINAVAALVGGGILLLALVVVVIVAVVANSPFGLFFAQEPNAPDTVSVSQAVCSVNVAYNSRLELLQAGDYDNVIVQGQAASWPDVLAVFAVKIAGADVDGLDVATLNTDRIAKLTTVFWDMTTIAVTEDSIDHPASGSNQAWTEKILRITITPKTADDMRVAYAFSAYQNSALDELLSDRSTLSSLAGDLTITSADVRDLLAALPADLEQARQDTVQTALQLVGKVTYFWGGKSRVIGWDSRWGQLKKVTAAGNSTSGTYRPFGLDCSGFVDWTFNNSLGYIIGHGGGARAQHTYCTNISQSEAQPGDLAFYPDDSHVGIIVGRNAAGKVLVCHCSSGSNNVVVTEFSISGFTAVGRPDIFTP